MNQDQQFAINRRAFLGWSAGGLGAMALAQLLEQDAAGSQVASGRAARVSHYPPAADSVICLFQHGGPSQMDLFDPKPELNKHHGKPYEGELEIHFTAQSGNILGSPFQFAPRGESGIELSELLPHTAKIVDDITLIRSVTTESVDHESALRLIHSGKFQAGHPTWGAWVTYGLGSMNRNLPAYVVLTDPDGMPVDNVRNWTSGWLPAEYQGTAFRPGDHPVPNLKRPANVTSGAQAGQLRFLEELNQAHLLRAGGNHELLARIQDYEVAARMQTTVPELLDISEETEDTRRLYGLDDPTTAEYGTRCLIARRLVERGVRFVQIFLASQPWDTHSNNAGGLKKNCARIDQPSAALVQDLKQRGLLDRTIVMWGGEFGRLPISQGKDGRDHNRHANSVWFAGGGFRQGLAYGHTDEFGYKAVENAVTVHDLHATLLHLLGLDHRRLTYPNDGRLGSLTDIDITQARIVTDVLKNA